MLIHQSLIKIIILIQLPTLQKQLRYLIIIINFIHLLIPMVCIRKFICVPFGYNLYSVHYLKLDQLEYDNNNKLLLLEIITLYYYCNID